jgi:hydrogenase large subunit
MKKRIVIDPITRIEGHLRIDVEVENGKVVDAWSSGQMFRGIEQILLGRDPRDAWLFTQRFCGVCTTVHAITSVRTVENALSLEIPLNAQYIRNLIMAAHAIHDHIVHFYALSALDWVDVLSAAKADPARAAALADGLSSWPGNSRRALEQVKQKLVGVAGSGQLGIFANGYWGHPAMKLSPEVNLLAVSHYLEALEVQRRANQVVALLGGKTPNIQNLAVGGVANPINLDNDTTLNMQKLFQLKNLLDSLRDFIEQVYLVDVCAIGGMYPDWLSHGKGVTDYLAVPDMPLDAKGTSFDMPGGTVSGIDAASYKPISRFGDPYFRDGVKENVAHAWYEGDSTKHPWEGETRAKYSEYDAAGKYSWIKAPRFEGRVTQVGPLAGLLVGLAAKHEPTARWANKAIALASKVAGVKVTPAMMESTLGRHAARMIRCGVLSELALKHWQLLVDNIAKGDVKTFNAPTFPAGEQRGFGFHEAPRGALSHWIVIRDGKIANYQAVVPSTWNAGPRDEKGNRGPYEASLIGNPVADTELPLEVLRTVHSFDPCIACAVHTVDLRTQKTSTVRVL